MVRTSWGLPSWISHTGRWRRALLLTMWSGNTVSLWPVLKITSFTSSGHEGRMLGWPLKLYTKVWNCECDFDQHSNQCFTKKSRQCEWTQNQISSEVLTVLVFIECMQQKEIWQIMFWYSYPWLNHGGRKNNRYCLLLCLHHPNDRCFLPTVKLRHLSIKQAFKFILKNGWNVNWLERSKA